MLEGVTLRRVASKPGQPFEVFMMFGCLGSPMIINNCHFDTLTNCGIYFDNVVSPQESDRFFSRLTDSEWRNSYNERSSLFRVDSNSHCHTERFHMEKNTAASFNGLNIVFGTINTYFQTRLYFDVLDSVFIKNVNPLFGTILWPVCLTKIYGTVIQETFG